MSLFAALLAATISDQDPRRAQELQGRLGLRESKKYTQLGRRLAAAVRQSGEIAAWCALRLLVMAGRGEDLTLSNDDIELLRKAGSAVSGADPHRLQADMLPMLPWLARELKVLLPERALPMIKQSLAPEQRSGLKAAAAVYALREVLPHNPVEISNIIDWVRAERPDLSRMSLQEAEAGQREWHRRLAAMPKGAPPSNAGEIIKLWDDGWSAHLLTSRRQLDWEGEMQSHCVGSYAEQVRIGSCQIISLRHEGMPVLTIEIDLDEDGEPRTVSQIKGKRNRGLGDEGDGYVDGEVDKAQELLEDVLGLEALGPRENPRYHISMGEDYLINLIREDPTLIHPGPFADMLYSGDGEGIEGIWTQPRVQTAWAELAEEEGVDVDEYPDIAVEQITLAVDSFLSEDEKESLRPRIISPSEPGMDWAARRKLGQIFSIASLNGTMKDERMEGQGGSEDIPPVEVKLREEISVGRGMKLRIMFYGVIYTGDGFVKTALAKTQLVGRGGEIVRESGDDNDLSWDELPELSTLSVAYDGYAKDIPGIILNDRGHTDWFRGAGAAIQALREDLDVESRGGIIDTLGVDPDRIAAHLEKVADRGYSDLEMDERHQGSIIYADNPLQVQAVISDIKSKRAPVHLVAKTGTGFNLYTITDGAVTGALVLDNEAPLFPVPPDHLAITTISTDSDGQGDKMAPVAAALAFANHEGFEVVIQYAYFKRTRDSQRAISEGDASEIGAILEPLVIYTYEDGEVAFEQMRRIRSQERNWAAVLIGAPYVKGNIYALPQDQQNIIVSRIKGGRL